MARFGFATFDSGVRFDAPDAHPTNMRNLSKFLENPFDDSTIGLPRLVGFTTDHLERMKANNPGNALDARITATQSALGLVQDFVVDDTMSLGQRKARKKAKDDFRAEVPAKVGMLAGSIAGKFGEDSGQMMECFPSGRTIFSSCTDDMLETHIEALKDAMTEHAADLGTGPIADVTGLLAGWNQVHDRSETSSAAKTATREEKVAARENLQLMLFLNLIEFMKMFPRQPEKLELYMRQSLLETHPAQPDAPVPPTPPATPAPPSL